MCRLALVGQASFVTLRARAWFEHVASADNPSDVLSRDGFEDPAVAHKVHTGEWERVEPVEPPTSSCSFDDMWRMMEYA